MSSKGYTPKTRETLCITRDRIAAALFTLLDSDVYVRPPSTHYPKEGSLYVVSRRLIRKTYKSKKVDKLAR